MAGPLHGVRVLDFTVFQQGPQATLVMADMAAETAWSSEQDGEALVTEMGIVREDRVNAGLATDDDRQTLRETVVSTCSVQVERIEEQAPVDVGQIHVPASNHTLDDKCGRFSPRAAAVREILKDFDGTAALVLRELAGSREWNASTAAG